tara:strand:- start:7514 stop:8632 length:1119 start_codon:yes stop_codon:yes gene_type:complete
MVAVSAAYPTNAYTAAYGQTAKSATTAANTTSSGGTTSASGSTGSAATEITLSSEAQAALAAKDFATVLAETKSKLTALLIEAGRTSPLQNDKLAVDLSSLDQRELFAMASDDSFSSDEQAAAGLEMQRRFEAAMAGPAAVAKVTGDYTGLYKAAAAYLDSLGDEEKKGTDWIAGREAVTDGLKQLQSDPKTMPEAGDHDPVALYLALANAGQTQQQDIKDVAAGARASLDALYAKAIKDGKAPTFNKNTVVGTYIDLSSFPSRTLSAIALNTDNKFAPEEASAAQAALRAKSGAALLAGFQNAAKSSDPTAFSQNIISIFSSMSAEERQAAGWSDKFYQAAVQSYQSTSKLTQMFAEAGGNATGFMSWMGK